MPTTVDAMALPGWVRFGPWVLLAIGAAFYGWVLATRPEKASFWGAMGDTVAPFATLFNVLALFAVLRSLQIQSQGLAEQRAALELQRKELRLQRRELRLQRQEFKDSREVMKEQKEQFERTAKAQEELVGAQNRQTLAQRSATVASLQAALVQVKIEQAKVKFTPFESHFQQLVPGLEAEIGRHLANETEEHEELARRMNEGESL